MTKKLLIIFFIFINFSILKSQHFTMTEVDTSNFPLVSASFLALNPMGDSYQDLSVEDFAIEENGIPIPRELYQLNCGYPPISVVLVLDQSNSMNDMAGSETRWDWVVSGVKSFVNSIDLSDSISKVSIVGFGGRAYARCPFTGVKQELLDTLSNMSALNATTNFNEPFLDPTNGAIELLKKRPSEYRRVIVFLTDGKHENMTATLRRDDIVERLREWNIQTYAITLLDDMNPDLNLIAERSGGDYYQIMNKTELGKIYDFIAKDAQGKIQCILSWPSELSCSEVSSFRKARIEFLKNNSVINREYKAPDWSIVRVETDEEIYDFDDPDVGVSVEKEIKITPRQYPFTIDDIKIIPDDFFEINWGNGYGREFTGTMLLNEGETRTFNVRFTQKNQKAYRQATLVMEGAPCPLEIPLVGGKSSLAITKPVAGDVFNTCKNIRIEWDGNNPDERISLYYTLNNGPWVLIRNNLSGQSFDWSPPQIDGEVKIRAQIQTQSLYKWAVSDGGKADEFVSTINVQNNDLYAVVCGTFKDSSTIGNNDLEVYGDNDIFLAKYDTEGNLVWAQSAGSKDEDNALAAVVDPIGDIYMTGIMHKGAIFERISPAAQYDYLPYLYLAKFSPNGQAQKVVTFGGESKYDNLRLYPVRMSYEFDNVSVPKIVIEGRYKGYYQDEDNDWILPNTSNFEKFFIIYDHNLNKVRITTKDVEMNNVVTSRDFDNQGNRYETGNFRDTRNFGAYQVTANEGQDYYISKYGQTNTSVDVSDAFEISVPKIKFMDESYNVGLCLVGDTCLKEIKGYLVNYGLFPVKITDAVIAGYQPEDFTLVTPLKDSTIAAGDTIDIQVNMQPDFIGYRSAELELSLECINDITLLIEGEGVCDALYDEVIDFGNVYVGKADTIIRSCIFKNPTSLDMKIEPIIMGDDWRHFKIYRTKDGEMLPKQTGFIDVPPDSCVELLIEYTPAGFGQSNAYIDYNMPMGCEEAITRLTGTGIDAELLTSPVDWGDRRILSTNDSLLTITNVGTITEKIISITFEDENLRNIFNPEYYGDVSIDMTGESDLDINISFQPADEIEYSTNVIIYIESKEEPLIVSLTGKGFLPKLETDYSCGEAVNAGETTTATIVVSNPSSSGDLNINRIYINNGDNEYEWLNGEPQDIIVPMNDSRVFDVIYTPKNGEPHNAQFIIEADNFDGTFTEEWRENNLNVACDAFDLDYTNPITFNNILVCKNTTDILEVTNSSVATDLIIFNSQATITGADADNFRINNNNDLTINPESTGEIIIDFVPDVMNQINYTATLTIPTSYGIDIVVSLIGDAEKISLSSAQASYIIEPGDNFTFPVRMEIPQLNNSVDVTNNAIQRIKLNIIFDNQMLKYVDNSISNNLNNWNWNEPVETEPGILEIEGSGNLSIPFEGTAFDIEFQVLLGLNDTTNILGKVDYECTDEEVFLTMLTYDEFCFNEGRSIITNQNYSVTVIDIPDHNTFEIDVFLSNDAPTNITVFNSLGQEVKIVADDYYESGYYKFSVSKDEIQSGVYFIKVISGPFSETESIMIIK
jgi:uncharacterized protein YegL